MSERTPRDPPDIARLRARLAEASARAERSERAGSGVADPKSARNQVDKIGNQLRRALELRRRQLAKIHVQAKQLGFDEDTYRAQVRRIGRGRTASSGELSASERGALLAEQRAEGAVEPQASSRLEAGSTPPLRTSAATASKARTSHWVRTLLGALGATDAYADAIAHRTWQVERWEWLDFERLHKLGQMLAIQRVRVAGRMPAPLPQEGEK